MFHIYCGDDHLGSLSVEALRVIVTLFVDPRPVPALTPPREAPPVDVTALRTTLKDLDALPLAALLRELGVVLHNRDIREWRVLTDVSDELLNEATLPARARLTEQAIDRKPLAEATRRAARAADRRSRRKA